jgi:hypothetical protein
MDAFGPSSHRNEKNGPGRLNERFWNEFLAAERIMIFERNKKRFYRHNPSNGLYELLTAQALKVHLSDVIREAEPVGVAAMELPLGWSVVLLWVQIVPEGRLGP